MSEERKEMGEMLATMLASPACPGVVREAIGTHLSELYQQADLMNPEIVRMLYIHLFAEQKAEANETEAVATGEKADTPDANKYIAPRELAVKAGMAPAETAEPRITAVPDQSHPDAVAEDEAEADTKELPLQAAAS